MSWTKAYQKLEFNNYIFGCWPAMQTGGERLGDRSGEERREERRGEKRTEERRAEKREREPRGEERRKEERGEESREERGQSEKYRKRAICNYEFGCWPAPLTIMILPGWG